MGFGGANAGCRCGVHVLRFAVHGSDNMKYKLGIEGKNGKCNLGFIKGSRFRAIDLEIRIKGAEFRVQSSE